MGPPFAINGSPLGPLSGPSGFPRHDLAGVSKKPVNPRLVGCCSALCIGVTDSGLSGRKNDLPDKRIASWPDLSSSYRRTH